MKTEWESVLKAIKTISDKHDVINKYTGRHFNVYSVSGMERDEVYTHSRMIGELLNPKGAHGQSGKYLKLFCDQLGLKVASHDRAAVSREKCVEEGRIDIYVVLPELLLIIENKIDTIDQDKQLERYHSHANRVSKSFAFLYLTLDGHAPSAVSLGKIDETGFKRIHNISYAKDILPWVESCLNQSQGLPNVHSGLLQYRNLVSKLTGEQHG